MGIVFALLAGIGYGINAVVVRLALRHMNPAMGTLISLVVSFPLMALLVLAVMPQQAYAVPAVALPWLAVMGMLNFFFGRRFNYMGIERVGVSRATPIIGTTPLMAALIAVAFAGEELTPILLLGILLVVGGVILIVREG